MDSVKKISICEDVALVTLKNSPSEMKFISHVFETIAQKGINVDMISQTAPAGKKINISFTVSDDELGKMMELFAAIRSEYPDVKYDVSAGNCKISLYGESMRIMPGVAADVFDTIADLNVDIGIITTSEIDISILVSKANFDTALEAFQRKYHLTAETSSPD